MKRVFTPLTQVVMALCLSTTAQLAQSQDDPEMIWAKVKATNQFQRSVIANSGVVVEHVADDYVTVAGLQTEINQIKKKFEVEVSFPLKKNMLDYPGRDARFHNYDELMAAVKSLAQNNPDIVKVTEIGRSIEGRPIVNIKITEDAARSTQSKPAIIFMGGHHAREHLSVELPLMLAQYIVAKYRNGIQQAENTLANREIHIIPIVNPDGSEYDIQDGNYKYWRKNRRRNANGSYGVDLNRNYSFRWGTGGSSRSGSSDTFMGPKPFSEPETQAIQRFVSQQKNATMLVSFHTFSELILFPWGHSTSRISNQRDFEAHKRIATQMSEWNGYRPMQASQLYVASGITSDWAYGDQNLFAFTFELDPKSRFEGGFYPGASKIDVVFQKNLRPCLYMIGLADNPYKVLQNPSQRFGLRNSNILE